MMSWQKKIIWHVGDEMRQNSEVESLGQGWRNKSESDFRDKIIYIESRSYFEMEIQR